jgi:hypothetical protein
MKLASYGIFKNGWILSIISLSICFSTVTIMLTHRVVNDDTYITLRYTKNLVENHQFTCNLNHPTYSLTTPLWAFGELGLTMHLF